MALGKKITCTTPGCEETYTPETGCPNCQQEKWKKRLADKKLKKECISNVEKCLIKLESKTLTEKQMIAEANLILEKLGSIDAMTATELGLGKKDLVLTVDLVKQAIKNTGLTVDQFIKKYLPHANENDILAIKAPIGSGGDEWGRSSRASDTR